MEVELVVRSGTELVPVTVTAAPGASVGDLRRALTEAGLTVALDSRVPIRGGGALAGQAPDEAPLSTLGLVRGGVLGDPPPRTAAGPALELAVLGGLHGGGSVPLSTGRPVPVGRSVPAGLSIADRQVSRCHVMVTAGDGGAVTVEDDSSANGTRLGAWRITGPTPLPADAVVGVGESILGVRAPAPGDAELTPDPQRAGWLLNRPPRIAAPGRLPELIVPVEPAQPQGFRFPWIATLAPAVLCGALYFVLPKGFGVYLLLMMALSPLMAVANLFSDRRTGRREYQRAKRDYDAAVVAFTAALERAAAEEEVAARAEQPDPAALVARTGSAGVDGPAAGLSAAGRPSASLWQRRRTDPDFLRLRVGLSDRPARLALRPDPTAIGAAARQRTPEPPLVRDVPVTVDLADAGVLGVAGPRDGVLAQGRALLAQAAILHSPAELGVLLITGRDTASDWEWASWLPHTAPVSSGFDCGRLLATDGAQAEARLAELRRLIEERTAERRSALVQGLPPGRAMLVLLDGARRLRDLPGVGELLATGPTAGVYALCLDADETALPDECGATVVTTNPAGTRGVLRRRGLPPAEDILLDGLVPAAAAAAARSLAPLRLLGERGADSALPERVRFFDLAGLPASATPPAGDSVTERIGYGAGPARPILKGREPQGQVPSDRIPSDWIPSDRISVGRQPEGQVPSDRIPVLRQPEGHVPSDWIPGGRQPENVPGGREANRWQSGARESDGQGPRDQERGGPLGELAAAVAAGWAASPQGRSTTALLGAGADGPVTVDLRRDGPHALIAGTSGAGKSELLQTLVASLALANQPDALTFVLVDYKGGSAFAACAELPHCVGLVTDLDGHLVSRALDSLSAELRRRETLFAAAGAKDIEDYWARTGQRLPRLAIVVDEFASLVEELPDFVPGVVGIGMRGRSLGVHVILATQRPAGVVTADLRANVNLRISLRVTAAAESTDVIDCADAARIPHRVPGRAYLRTGHAELTSFQAARVGWPRGAADPAGGPAVTVHRRRMETLGAPLARAGATEAGDAGPTDLTELVAAIRAAASAAGLSAPPRPWLPPLPSTVEFQRLPAPLTPGAVLGLVDRPTAQAQDAFVLDLAATGPVAIAGAVRAGRSTALRTLATALATTASPVDLHLYALDCGNRALHPLAALPHCGAVVDGDDQQRTERLLAFLLTETARRQRAGTTAPQVVLLIDRLEAFLARYGELDGGRLVDRVEELLRVGPAVGITPVLATDRTGFGHRIASAVAARLVLRQATVDDALAFGVPPRVLPASMPPGRAVWATTGEELQIAYLDPAELPALGAALAARWDGLPPQRLPHRLDPLPDEIHAGQAATLRRHTAPATPAACTPAAGGDHLGPIDLDLAEAGGTFLVAGAQRSGRSTALLAIATSLAGRRDGSLPVLAITPRSSPLRELAGLPGVLGVLDGEPEGLITAIEDAAASGPVALLVDDAELLTHYALADALEGFARRCRDSGSLLVAAASTEDVLANQFRGWLATVRRPRSGLLLNPTSSTDGEVFGLRLPRSHNGGWPAGRGLLVRRGEPAVVQVLLPAPLSAGATQ